MEEILKQCIGKLDVLLVDRAVYDFQQILEWYESYRILVLVKPKCNAVLPDILSMIQLHHVAPNKKNLYSGLIWIGKTRYIHDLEG